ncbi:MAG: amino acid permease [Cyanobacteria bacterium P01_F01_bin.150]
MKSWFKLSASNPTTPSSEEATGLGTFGGVYTPSILTILGVIMYLRFGWVVGNVGLLGTLAIVTLSTAITFLTALSVCAIATDRVVRVGGAYYMISRSLGIETGGAVGIPLYFAQALSVALYTLGFAESVVAVTGWNQVYVALGTTVFVAVLAMASASLAIRTQYIIMVAIAVSLVSFGMGHPLEGASGIFWGPPESATEPFWGVFAVFFPAVTGIMAGVNMSGDLKTPTQSIPSGTLAAVGTGYIIYMILPLFLAMRADADTLLTEPLVMQQIALWGPAILLGVWGATLSSAIGSIMGAPRVLQALARDGVLPRWMSFLGTGSGPDDEPRIGTMVTLVVSVGAVCIGDLNIIAPVLTMFFLTTYLVLNVSAFIEDVLQSPSFRPTFRVHWSLSLLGAIGCVAVMFLIDALATIVAGVIVLIIFFWLQRRELRATWGDARRGIWMALMRTGILQLSATTEDAKNWRPHILTLSGSPAKRWSLVELADALTHKRGLVTVSSVLPSGSRDVGQQTNMEQTIRDYLDRRGVQALVRIVTAPDPFEGAMQLVETYGIGPLVPNTILLGDSEESTRRDAYCGLIAQLHQAQRNVVILRENSDRRFGRKRRIDVWWGGRQDNGGLMLLLADLLCSNIAWRKATIHLKLMVNDELAAQAARANLDRLTHEFRIETEPQVLVSNNRSFDQVLHESSQNADLIFLGMATPMENYSDYYENLQKRTMNLPTILFVLASADFTVTEVLTEK